MSKRTGLAALAAMMAVSFGCAGKKDQGSGEHFGVQVHQPKFQGPGHFFRDLKRVSGVVLRQKLDGEPVDLSWITPAFREKLCLTVTINNHCAGG
jgi:hypothetical protein